MSCQTKTDETVYVAVPRGDSLFLTVRLGTDSGAADVTGWTWLAQVRDQADVLAATFTVTPTDPTNGVVELTLSPAETGAMTPGDYRWDLQGTDQNADVRTLAVGKLRIREDVSR